MSHASSEIACSQIRTIATGLERDMEAYRARMGDKANLSIIERYVERINGLREAVAVFEQIGPAPSLAAQLANQVRALRDRGEAITGFTLQYQMYKGPYRPLFYLHTLKND